LGQVVYFQSTFTPVKDGLIVGIGKAGNPDSMANIHPCLIIGSSIEVNNLTPAKNPISSNLNQTFKIYMHSLQIIAQRVTPAARSKPRWQSYSSVTAPQPITTPLYISNSTGKGSPTRQFEEQICCGLCW